MKLHIFPASGKSAQLNYHLTIRNKVSNNLIKNYIPNIQNKLLRAEGNPVWGTTDYHKNKVNKMQYGDYALFYRKYKIFSAGKIIFKKDDIDLGEKLWKHSETKYQHIILLESISYIDIHTDKLAKALNDYASMFLTNKFYRLPLKYMGYTSYDDDRSDFIAKELNLNKLLGYEEFLPEPDSSEFSVIEGEKKLNLHYRIERNSNIIRLKKDRELKNKGFLACEICNFNFEEKYGSLGIGYIECHHNIPLSKVKSGVETKLSDLSLLCSNCHRMIHRKGGRDKSQLLKIYKKYK